MAPSSLPESTAESASVKASPATLPALLLWTKQIRLEHGHLYNRMNDLEGQHKAYGTRIKAAEDAVNATKNHGQEINILAQSLSTLSHSENCTKEGFSKLGERLDHAEDSLEQCRRAQQKTSLLEMQLHQLQLDIKEVAVNQDSGLKLIQGIEVKLQSQELGTRKAVMQPDTTDVRALVLRLDAVQSHRTYEAKQMLDMQERIRALEKVCEGYMIRNEELHTRFEENQLQAARTTRDHALQSMEDSTKSLDRHHSTCIHAHVQVPATPPPMRHQSPITILEAISARNAKQMWPAKGRVRASQQNAQIVSTQSVATQLIPTQLEPTQEEPTPIQIHSRTVTPDLDAPYRNTMLQSSPDTDKKRKKAPDDKAAIKLVAVSKKRRVASDYEPRQTRSQARQSHAVSRIHGRELSPVSRRSKLIILKVPLVDSKACRDSRDTATVQRPAPIRRSERLSFSKPTPNQAKVIPLKLESDSRSSALKMNKKLKRKK